MARFLWSNGFVLSLLLLVALGQAYGEAIQEPAFSRENLTAIHRKLLASTNDDYGDGNDDGSPNRIESACSKDNILVFQGPNSPLPSGIPTYTVQICISGSCGISDIHLSCGWFSSARLIDPRIFRRLDYDDCLVNDGEPLNPGECISFQYANSFKYPLSVSSVAC